MAPQSESEETAEFAGLYAAASELCRRGWRVGMTLGNTKAYDLMAAWPSTGGVITIDVKSKWSTRPDGRPKERHWLCTNLLSGAEKTRTNHFFVFVKVHRGANVVHDYYVVPGRVAIARPKRNIAIGRRKGQAKQTQYRIFDSPREDPDKEHIADYKGWGALPELAAGVRTSGREQTRGLLSREPDRAHPRPTRSQRQHGAIAPSRLYWSRSATLPARSESQVATNSSSRI